MYDILVTGGTGYIGSNFCLSYLEKYPLRKILIIDNCVRGGNYNQLKDIENIKIIKKDLVNLDLDDIKDFTGSEVVHFAANAYVGESQENPNLYLTNNTLSTIKLLDVLSDRSDLNIVFSSSCAVYGENQSSVNENNIGIPLSNYGWSKLFCEYVLKHHNAMMKYSIKILRYFNVAGAFPERKIGEFHDPEPHIIPNFYDMITTKKHVKINGNDFPTSDGTCVREYIHVRDLVDAHLASLTFSDFGTHTINISSEQTVSNLELAVSFADVLGYGNLQIIYNDRRMGDVPIITSHSVNKNLIKFEAQCSDINQILRDYAAWRVNNATG